MYSLLVSYQVEERTEGALELSVDRFLEYTEDSIAGQLGSLSNEGISCLTSWPLILMQEGRGQESAYVGQISTIKKAAKLIKITVARIPSQVPIFNGNLWKIRAELDIEQFEFNRNHWAVKDRDLFTILRHAGYRFPVSVVRRFKNRPLPAPPRPHLINAGKVIARWGHTRIDRFLLEAGVEGLSAARAMGSSADRANAITQFALEKAGAITADNSLFSAFILSAIKASNKNPKTKDALRDTDLQPVTTRPKPALKKVSDRSPNRVFVVHGQNDSVRSAVASFLTQVGLEPIVLHAQPSMGRHLLTKFIEEAELVTFAVILMTDDDVGALKGFDLTPRARQNVILELGYFLSHLGQARICALITPGLDTPSDFDGIVYIEMDKEERWQTELERELRAAGMPLIQS